MNGMARLLVDIGNTRVKRALAAGESLIDDESAVEHAIACGGVERAIVCATGAVDAASMALGTERVHWLTGRSRLPIVLDYATPATLGPDRIAAACGAAKVLPGCNTVIIDAGTCITIDFLEQGRTYRGGAILPGMGMKFRALHTFTEKLPLMEGHDKCESLVTGRSTEESMVAGVLTATRFAVEAFVAHYRQRYADVRVLLTGGDAERLVDAGLSETKKCTIVPNLVIIGLNEILKENEE